MIQENQKTAFSQSMQLQDSARANLQIYQNLLTQGNMNYNNLDANQKVAINKLEVQAGFPVGFTSTLKMNPSDSILAYSTDKTQAFVSDGNGGFNIIQTGLKNNTTASNTQVKSAIGILNTVDKTYKTVNGKAVTQVGGVDVGQVADRYLSGAEQDAAYQKILESVGGDEDLAEKLFKQAWEVGKFKVYGG